MNITVKAKDVAGRTGYKGRPVLFYLTKDDRIITARNYPDLCGVSHVPPSAFFSASDDFKAMYFVSEEQAQEAAEEIRRNAWRLKHNFAVVRKEDLADGLKHAEILLVEREPRIKTLEDGTKAVKGFVVNGGYSAWFTSDIFVRATGDNEPDLPQEIQVVWSGSIVELGKEFDDLTYEEYLELVREEILNERAPTPTPGL